MIGFSLGDMIGGEPVEYGPETDRSFRRRVLTVCDPDDIRAAEIATGAILDEIAGKYGLQRNWQEAEG